ncbi:hypothetical protein ACWGK9_44550, partial [Streptomyces rubiginosohelvolus]
RRQTQRMLNRTRLAEFVMNTSEERTAARKVAHRLLQEIQANRAEQNKVNSRILLYPPSPDLNARYAQLSDDRTKLVREHRYASAHQAAADVVHESAVFERAWADRPELRGPDGRMLASVVYQPVGRVASAAVYRATVLHLNPRDGRHWQGVHYTTVKRSTARSLLEAWAGQEQAYVLRDPHGRLYVATPTVRLELTPTDIERPHTEGDALRAALTAYDLPAYDDTDGPASWLCVPLEPFISHEETHESPHFRISSQKHADRPASRHGERWTAAFYDENGWHVTTLDASPEGSTLAEDCAHVACAIATFASTRH